MTEASVADRTVWTTPRRVGLIVLVVLVCFIVGVGIGNRGFTSLQRAHVTLQNESQRLTAEKNAVQAENARLSRELKSAQDKLAELSSNVYEIKSNQSRRVPTDHFTIGLVGTPGNQKVELNINDQQYSAAAGEAINIDLQQSLACRIEVMSFDVIEARVTLKATCAEVKH